MSRSSSSWTPSEIYVGDATSGGRSANYLLSTSWPDVYIPWAKRIFVLWVGFSSVAVNGVNSFPLRRNICFISTPMHLAPSASGQGKQSLSHLACGTESQLLPPTRLKGMDGGVVISLDLGSRYTQFKPDDLIHLWNGWPRYLAQ